MVRCPTEKQIYEYIKANPWTNGMAVRDHFGQHGTKNIISGNGFLLLPGTTAKFYEKLANVIRRDDVDAKPDVEYMATSKTTLYVDGCPYLQCIYAVI